MSKLTRRVLLRQVAELKERLAAAGGETRQNMRNRLARTTEELAKEKAAHERTQATVKHQDGLLREVAFALKDHKGGPAEKLYEEKLKAYVTIVPPSIPSSPA